jgi:hypothetical protein
MNTETNTHNNIMNCDVILTFDKMYDDETQAHLNFEIEVEAGDTNLREFVVNKLFLVVAEWFMSNEMGHKTDWLSIVSTSCDWGVYERVTGNYDKTERGSGKWNFAECDKYKLESKTLAYELKYKYCFGTYTDNSWFWDNIDQDSAKTNDAYLEYLCGNSSDGQDIIWD